MLILELWEDTYGLFGLLDASLDFLNESLGFIVDLLDSILADDVKGLFWGEFALSEARLRRGPRRHGEPESP